MKRSNRLIMLIGIFLAIVAFVLVIVFLGGRSDGGEGEGPRTQVGQVYSKAAIPLGTLVTQQNYASLFEEKKVAQPDVVAGVLTSSQLTIGQTVRKDVVAGEPITNETFGGSAQLKVPAGFRAVGIQVDQVTGAGTLIKPGDWVDVVVGFPGENFPVIQVDPETDQVEPIAGLNGTSVKMLIQQLQVIGTLLPPPQTNEQGEPVEGDPTLSSGQQEIVIVAVNAAQAEIIKFAQMQGNITLALRSIEDFQGDIKPLPDITDGIILKKLVDAYGVLPPELIETELPKP